LQKSVYYNDEKICGKVCYEKIQQGKYIYIRFPVEINDNITEIVKTANKNMSKKDYGFNGFVISACEYALKNMEE